MVPKLFCALRLSGKHLKYINGLYPRTTESRFRENEVQKSEICKLKLGDSNKQSSLEIL